MPHSSVPKVPTGLSTQIHIAVPRRTVRHRPAYGPSFGLAAMLLSIVGVDALHEVVNEAAAAETAVVSDETRRPALTEWDEWKSARDLG